MLVTLSRSLCFTLPIHKCFRVIWWILTLFPILITPQYIIISPNQLWKVFGNTSRGLNFWVLIRSDNTCCWMAWSATITFDRVDNKKDWVISTIYHSLRENLCISCTISTNDDFPWFLLITKTVHLCQCICICVCVKMKIYNLYKIII